MRVWQNFTSENTKQIDEIIEKREIMLNKLKSLELARKVVRKGFIKVLWS